MTNLFKRWSLFLTGDFSNFSMENRAFNLVSGLVSILLTFVIIAYITLGFVSIALWMTLMMAINSYLFYLARFRGKFAAASLTFAVISYITLCVAYVLNSGINGPVIYGFFMTLILNIVISPRKLQLFWISLHLIIVPMLLVSEYYFPGTVKSNYLSKADYFIDYAITYVPCILFLGSLGIFLTSSYNFEKKSAQSSRHELEKKNEELEFTNKEKDRLFSIIAHDLKSPLNSIRAYLEMLDFDQLDPEDRGFLNNQLLGLTHNTSNLLNNLLNWSVRNSLEETELKPLHLANHLSEVINLMKPESDRKNIELILQVEDPHVTLLGESEMLHLVVRNLINNAIKFSPENTQITIKALVENGKTVISVKDNGLGIPPEQQLAIFGSQVKPAIGTKSEKGIGLGLVLCHDFVKAMKGSIEFRSKVNEGTEFTITLNKAS